MAIFGKITKEKIRLGATEHKPFRAGNVSGSTDVQYGKLPDEWADRLRAADVRGQVRYVFYSYSTPIAWLVGDEWVVPTVKYSVSTTGHQSAIGHATGVYAR